MHLLGGIDFSLLLDQIIKNNAKSVRKFVVI